LDEEDGSDATTPVPAPAAGKRRPREQVRTLESLVNLPSEVPTRRPPDVELRRHEPGARGGPASESVPARVSAPPPSSPAGAHLPSVILASDVESELPAEKGRALRASKDTVRLELPPGFGMTAPGVPLRPGMRVASGHPAAATPAAVKTRPAAAKPKNTLLWVIAGGLLLAALAVLLVPRLDAPTSGSLVVTARGPGNRPVEGVEIYVDDQRLCDVSPCKIAGLGAGPHRVRARGTDLATIGEQTVTVTAGAEAVVNVELEPAEPELKAGSMRVAAGDQPLTLFVDGHRVGKLPQTVPGLSGGKHWIKLEPDPGAEGGRVIEKAVVVEPGQVVDVSPVPAKTDRVLVTIVLDDASEGASVTLNEAFLLDFPAELELDPSTVHSLVASKPGFEELQLEIELDPDEPTRTIEVALEPTGARKSTRRAARARRKPKKAASSPAADRTQGLLTITSVPPSQVILNGRPLGTTPRNAVAVPGDSLQTIVFVHPTMGRRRAQKFVPAGKKRTVAIRF
jgi:serine/threonine-protein kinase